MHQGRVVKRRVLAYARHAVVDQRLCVCALHSAGERLVGRVLDTHVQEPAFGQRQAGVCGHRPGLLALVELTVVQPNLTAFGIAPGHQVDDAGDGVGPVLCRGAVAQHLDPLQRDARNHAHVGSVGALAGRGYELGDDRGAVAAFAVDHHECLIRCQARAAKSGARTCRRRPMRSRR